PLAAAGARRRGRPRVPRSLAAPRRPARADPVPVPAQSGVRPLADRGLRRIPPAGREGGDGVPPSVVAGGAPDPRRPGGRVVLSGNRREGGGRADVGAVRLSPTPQD